MKYHDETDQYELSTGRFLEANYGIIGIDPCGGIYDGYDSSCEIRDASGQYLGRASKDLSPAERTELAEYMIEQWRKFGGLDVIACTEKMKGMTAEQRMEIMGNFCRDCGDNDPRCQCWNDE